MGRALQVSPVKKNGQDSQHSYNVQMGYRCKFGGRRRRAQATEYSLLTTAMMSEGKAETKRCRCKNAMGRRLRWFMDGIEDDNN